ncbi:hypothetical protein [uncultured Paraglaciecola sp.]|uniref:hypothetical protein n=1 Tax=uncultured Paraglaciecola sp. TaxID=1765024 RepID=UPI0025DFA77B|nr:hypothetical protein [uncultured Paraglaciecola sp.]
MKSPKTLSKILAFFTVCLLLSKPELIALGLFIDAIGLEMFVMLLQAQVIAIGSYYFHVWLKPVFKPFYRFLDKHDPYFFVPTKAAVKECPALLCHAMPFLVVLIVGMSVAKYPVDLT